MKVAGIIAEYNPFHKGHQYHIEETRKKTGVDYVVVVMSGDYVQRGEPAIADKYMTQANRLWAEIYQIIRENCTSEYTGASPQDDVMERLLRARKGR